MTHYQLSRLPFIVFLLRPTMAAHADIPAAPHTHGDSHIDLTRICDQELSNDEAVNFVSDPKCGAIATFLGVTRDNFQGKLVDKLSYEAYVPMAQQEMRRLCATARERVARCLVSIRDG